MLKISSEWKKKVFLIPSLQTLEADSAHIKVNNKQQQTFPFPMIKHENMKKFSTSRLFDELRADF
jgi:hypothetical protein